MADISKTVEIIFEGVDKMGGGIDSVLSGMSSLSGQVESLAQPLADVGDGIVAMDTALAALAAGSLLYATSKAIDFESAAIELDKVLSEEEGLAGTLEVAKQKAIEMSEKYGESATDILNAMAEFKQAGFDVDDSMQLVANSMDLVIAGGLEASDASELLVATLKGFKAPAEEAGRVVDILNAISNEYATNVEELAKGMSGLSPIASQMGLSFEETAGVLTPVIEVFRSGDEAAIALKTGLLKLIDDTQPVKDALASIGVSQTDANGALRSGKDILYDVMEAFKGLTDSEKLYVTQQLVGIDQAARMVEVFDQGNKVMEVTKTALGSAGSAAAEVAKRLESTEVQVKRFSTTFENLATAVGTNFLDATAKAAGGAADLNQAIREAVEAGSFDPLFEALNKVGERIGEVLTGMAQAFPEAIEQVDFTGLIEALQNLGGSFGEFWGTMDLTDPEDLADAIQWVVDTMESLVTVTHGIVEAWEPFIEGIINSITGFNQLDDSTKKSAGNITGVAQAIVHLGTEFAAAIVVMGDNVDAIESTFRVVINSVQFLWNSVETAIDAVVVTVIDLFERLLDIADTVSFGAFSEEIDGVRSTLEGWKGAWQDAFIEDAGQARDNIAGIAEGFGLIKSGAEDAQDGVKDLGEGIGQLPKTTTIELALEQKGYTLEDFWTIFETLPDAKQIEIKTLFQQGEVEKGVALVVAEMEKLPKEQQVTVKAEADKESISKTEKTIKEKIPEKKTMEVEAKIEIANIEAEAKKITAAFEAMANIQVAQIEADAKKVVAAYESITASIETTGDVLQGLFDLYGDSSKYDKLQIEDWIEDQLEIQREQLDLQKKLVEEQIAYMKQKRETLASGESLVTISADGLEPELEAFMWRILEKIQVRVAEDQAEFLLGLGSLST